MYRTADHRFGRVELLVPSAYRNVPVPYDLKLAVEAARLDTNQSQLRMRSLCPSARVPYIEMVVPAIANLLSCLVGEWARFPSKFKDLDFKDGREEFSSDWLSKQGREYGPDRADSDERIYNHVPEVLYFRHTASLYCVFCKIEI